MGDLTSFRGVRANLASQIRGDVDEPKRGGRTAAMKGSAQGA